MNFVNGNYVVFGNIAECLSRPRSINQFPVDNRHERQGQRLIVENFLRFRFGELDEGMLAVIEPLSVLPAEELTLLLLRLSQLGGESPGIEEGKRLVVENLLQIRLGKLDEQNIVRVDSLLALPPIELRELLLQLCQFSRDELLSRLGELLG